MKQENTFRISLPSLIHARPSQISSGFFLSRSSTTRA